MSRRTQNLSLLLIIVLGLSLRLVGFQWHQGYQFSAIGDEIEAYQTGLRLLAGDREALHLGQPNFKAGKVPGPLWAMLWAAGIRWGSGPETVILMLIALNTVVIWLVFVLGKNLFDPAHGLWAALLMATAPLPVCYSLGCTNPGMMAVLGALLYLALWAVIRQPKSAHIFWVVVVLAMMPQFHMICVFLIPPVVLLLVLRRREIHWRWLLAGLAAAAILYAPYVWGETQTHWINTRRYFVNQDKFSAGSLNALTTPVGSLANLIESNGGRRFTDYRSFGNAVFGSFYVLAAFNALSLLLSVLAIGSFIGAFFRSLRRHGWKLGDALASAPAVVFIGVMLLLPVLLFLPTGATFNGRYAIVAHPLLFLLPAMLLAQVRYRGLILAGVAVTIAFNLYLCPAFFHYQNERIAHADYFIPSFRKMESVYQRIRADVRANDQPQLVAVGFPADRDAPLTHGADLLARYVNLRGQFDHPGAPRRFRVEPRNSLIDKTGRIVYQGNGIAVVEDDKDNKDERID